MTKWLSVAAFVVGTISALTGVAMFAVAFLLDKQGSAGDRGVVVVSGLILLALAAVVYVVWRRKRRTVLFLHRGGLVHQFGSVRRELLWRDIASSKYVAVGWGAYRTTSLNLRTHAGYKLTLHAQHVQDLHVIAAVLARETAALSVPAMRAHLSIGAKVSFGKITLSPKGVHYGRRMLPWADVAGAFMNLDRLWILRHGAPRPAFSVLGANVERTDALLTLIRERIQRYPAPPFELSPFARGVVWRGLLHALWVAPVAGMGLWLFIYLAWKAALDMRARASAGLASTLPSLFVSLGGLALFLLMALTWWRDVVARRSKLRVTKGLLETGRLVRVMLLERHTNQWGIFSRYDYRYLTPAGIEASDSIDALVGGAAAYTNGDDHLLALCSPDQAQSVLISASGYPLSRFPLAAATSNESDQDA